MSRTTTFHKLYFHFVWATKYRLPLLTPAIADRVCSFVVAKCRELDYGMIAVNSMPDHMHVLLPLRPTVLVADAAKMLKGSSAHFGNAILGGGDSPYWQDGYGAVSLRESDVPVTARHIQNQRQHHAAGELDPGLELVPPGGG